MDLLLAFVVLMVAGGAIAYFGDWLGYTMGKKRISFLKMRPRHTATAFTVAAGVFFAAFALLLLLFVDKTFRDALAQGHQLLVANHHLRAENRISQREAQDALRNAKNARAEADQDRKDAQTAQAQAMKAVSDLKAAQASLVKAQSDVKVAQTQLQGRQAQLAKAEQQLTATQADIQQARAESQRLERENQAETVALGAQNTALRGKAFGTLVYRDTQEVGRVVIPAYEPQAAIHGALERFLNGLSSQAVQDGATRGDNGRAVVVATVQLNDQASPRGTGGQDAQLVPENGSIDALATQIRAYGHGSVVVIASALGNAFSGKPVVIQLHPYANKLAIRGGTVLGETMMASQGDSPDQIVRNLQAFLVTTIRPAAKRAGVIPVREPQEHLGDVSLDQIIDLAQRIQQLKGNAVITVSAANDTYSADKLVLDFTVRPAAFSGTGVSAHVQP